MPICFQLYRKGEDQPSILQHVDDEICAWRGVEPDKIHYYMRWFDVIGFELAMGKSFEQIHEDLEELRAEPREGWKDANEISEAYAELIEINRYLSEHFVSSSFYESRSMSKG